ncbi:MAG TPA: NAD(P)H-dependent oxidoreductase [Steroidobacteraceae bacterium]|jgi:NAD(P)H-dependent FMN reductase/ketosteroid isomerase-like protein
MPTTKVAVIIGSLRKASFSRKAAQALIALAPDTLQCSILEIGDLPLYNEDLDGNPPAAWTRFRSELKSHQAVMFLTPEYNRSIPGCLKNALDVGSRPQGRSVFDGMPACVVSITPYQLGAFGANHALRQTFVFLNMPVMQQPEAYIHSAAELFDEQGGLKSKATRTFFSSFMAAFAQWTAKAGKRTQPGSASADKAQAESSGAAESFGDFLRRRRDIAHSYICGNAAPLDTILPQSGGASFFPPNGGSVQGAREVASRYDKDAGSFAPGGAAELQVIQSGTTGELAFWTGFQSAEAHVKSRKETVHMKLRVTEVFRYQDGRWLLIHRHADAADQSGSPDRAGARSSAQPGAINH